jgi:hypothetical protein
LAGESIRPQISLRSPPHLVYQRNIGKIALKPRQKSLVKHTTKHFFVKKKMEGRNLNPTLNKEAKND